MFEKLGKTVRQSVWTLEHVVGYGIGYVIGAVEGYVTALIQTAMTNERGSNK